MMQQNWMTTMLLSIAMTFCVTMTAAADLTTNGNFETGDTSGWVSFPTANSTFNTTVDSNSGAFAGEIFNDDPASAAVVKQANLGVGQVTAGEVINISFAAKGEGAVGGVAFAEFFSEISGGGTSSGGILSGGPLALTNNWQTFNFSVVTGPDVSGGVTLQFAVATGAAGGSTSRLFIDDVSVSRAVPEPAATALLSLGGLGMLMRRRKR